MQELKLNQEKSQEAHVPTEEEMDLRLRKATNERRLKDLTIPGWYRDTRGAVCITNNGNLVSIFVNDEDGLIDVCMDTLDQQGVFSRNLLWESFDSMSPAVNRACAIYLALQVGNMILLGVAANGTPRRK